MIRFSFQTSLDMITYSLEIIFRVFVFLCTGAAKFSHHGNQRQGTRVDNKRRFSTQGALATDLAYVQEQLAKAGCF